MPTPLTALESSGRVVLAISGSLTKDRLEALNERIALSKKMIEDASGKAGRKIDILLDLSGFGGVYDVEAMEAMAGFAKDNERFVRKTAAFGGPDKAVAAGEVTAALADRGNIRFFPTGDEALAWLDEA